MKTPSASQTHSPHSASYEINGQHVSAQDFYAVACNPERNVVVEACAGSGKTWILVARMLRILLDGGQPEAILAMTFTKKAAAEMQQRLQALLQDLAEANVEERITLLQQRGLDLEQARSLQAKAQRLYEQLLESPQGVRVRTFHAWFAQLLRVAPWAFLQSLGLPADYELQEDTQDILARTWPRFYALLQQESQHHVYAIYQSLVTDYGRSQVQDLFESALARPVELGLVQDKPALIHAIKPWYQEMQQNAHPILAQIPQQHLQGLETELDALLQVPAAQQLLRSSHEVLNNHTSKTAQGAAQKLAPILERVSAQSPQAGDWSTIADIFLTKEGVPRSRGFPENNAVLQEMQSLVSEVQILQAQARAHQLQTRMASLSGLLLECYAGVKRTHGWVDMGDIERAAHALLQNQELSAWVQERLDAHTNHILIDEFQDTNPLQWQTLQVWLSAYAGIGGGKAMRIFLVGDPKQSIYRFRGAQPEVFQAAKVFLQEAGWDAALLACDHTRRNAQAILDLINPVMHEAQQQGQYQGFRQHSSQIALDGGLSIPAEQIGSSVASVPFQGRFYLPEIERSPRSKKDPNAPRPPWRDSLLQAKYTEEVVLRNQEAEQAAQVVAQIHAAGTPLASIMVLARKRVALEAMSLALRDQGLAAHLVEKAQLQKQAAVADILALWDALLSSWNHLSLAQTLKSPLFRFTEKQLLALAKQAKAQAKAHSTVSETNASKANWWQVLIEQYPSVAAQLTRWQTWAKHLPPYDALDAIYHDCDIWALYTAAVAPSQRSEVLQHLEALLQTALDLQGGRFLDAYGFLRKLRHTPINLSRAPNNQAVQLLTIHGAKGLEADVVLLLDTQSVDKKRSMSLLVQWPAKEQSPTDFSFVESESRPARGLKSALQQEAVAKAREELNALYVALTRARRLLLVSSVQGNTKQTTWWSRLHAHAQAWPVPIPTLIPTPTPAAQQKSILPQKGHTSNNTAFVLPDCTRSTDKVCLPFAQTATAFANARVDNDSNNTEDTHDAINAKLASQLGIAVHWLLQWAQTPQVATVLAMNSNPPATAPAPAPAPATATATALDNATNSAQSTQDSTAEYELLKEVSTRFTLETMQAKQVLEQARKMRHGPAAWVWDTAGLRFEANEVELQHAGKTLRLDRLLQCADHTWWVLDYKSTYKPLQQQALREQLNTYAIAIQSLYPRDNVKAAFINAQGQLLVLDSNTDTT